MRSMASLMAGASKKAPAVTGVVVVVGSAANKASVSWTNPDPSLYTGIKVEQNIESAGYTTVAANLSVGTTSLEVTQGYSCDALYRVTALRSTGVDADPVVSSSFRTAPNVPSLVSLTATNPGLLDLVATSPGGTRVDGFDVQISTDGGSSWSSTVDTGVDPSHQYTGVGHGLPCRVRCRQRDALGQTSAWATWPTNVTSYNDTTGPVCGDVTLGSWNQAGPGWDLTYTATTDAGTSVSAVFLQANYNGAGWTTVSAVSVAGGSGTAIVPDANRGQTVKYRLTALDSFGNSSNGSESSTKTSKPKGTFYVLATSSDTYHAGSGAGWYGSGGTQYHGSGDPGSGNQTGCWFYGTQIADVCKGYAPDSATIFMKRKLSAGSTGYNHIQPHSHASKPAGAPTLVSTEDNGPYLSGSDDSAYHPLPAAHLTAMGAGTVVGMATVDSGSWRGLYKLTDNADEGRLALTFS